MMSEWQGQPLQASPAPRPVAKSSARRGVVSPVVGACLHGVAVQQAGANLAPAHAAPSVLRRARRAREPQSLL